MQLRRIVARERAQRRPGPQSRRHGERMGSFAKIGSHRAQRRPGPQSRRHPRTRHNARRRMSIPRSTKAGTAVPATLVQLVAGSFLAATRAPLNEGRDRSPGDTAVMLATARTGVGSLVHAQRRPGPQSRRHPPRWHRRAIAMQVGPSLNEGRDRSPGDTWTAEVCGADRPSYCAQRRPGPQSRRHESELGRDMHRLKPRSTKAGTAVPGEHPSGVLTSSAG